MVEQINKLDTSGLRATALPEEWYISDADDLNDSWEYAKDETRLPTGWFAVCTPDGGVMAAFPSHELAFAYMVTIIYGRGGVNPARADYERYGEG